jgi:hypothetical protein
VAEGEAEVEVVGAGRDEKRDDGGAVGGVEVEGVDRPHDRFDNGGGGKDVQRQLRQLEVPPRLLRPHALRRKVKDDVNNVAQVRRVDGGGVKLWQRQGRGGGGLTPLGVLKAVCEGQREGHPREGVPQRRVLSKTALEIAVRSLPK